ncbi:MAG: hypothetical protein JSV52_08130 [Candidatus Zixiibacteriota bacterium]|nr:MAG: hypothetical protein JSV52_08130 [candidate division Zixibacteria bacterium]
MNRILDLKYTIAVLAIVGIIGALLSWFSGLSFWASLAIVVAAMVLNGILAVFEDDLPGGFNNPMSEYEMKSAKEERMKRLLRIRIGMWVVIVLILIWFVWLYFNKSA